MRVRFAPSPDRRAAHRRRAHRALQLAAGARQRRDARPAHRGHRPRALDARERRADPRRAALARARLGRGPDLPGRAHRAATSEVVAAAARRAATPTARRATGDDVKAYKAQHGADRGFRGEDEGEGAVRLRVPDEGETVVHDLIRGDTTFRARPPRRPGDRPRRRQRRSTTSRSRSTTSTPASRTSSAARTTSPTRPSSCSSTRRSARQPPVYAHLPLLHGPDGKKLSKRHGAASVQELRDAGYLPEAVRNYLALLGWGDADDETIISTDELVERFDIARVSQEPGALRRAEAALDERPLPARAGRRRADARAWRRSPGAPACATRSRSRAEKIQTLARLLAAGRLHLRRPGRRPARRARSGSATEGRGALARRARGARRRSTRSTSSAIEAALRGVVEARGRQAQGRLPADPRRARRDDGLAGHLRDARGARAATRRCGGSTRR